ncbi:uncharacterized protein [Rutidosis leptorrhynchoides]|uniref:uncharacterized protein n=1 Tax=Rutidosis leptorrhynchoides TaxID=125765 RepID=UPI003A9A3E97
MAVSTRANSGEDSNSLETLRSTVAALNQTVAAMATKLDDVILQQRYLSTNRNGDGLYNRNTQMARFTKLELPKFDGEDVKEWLYRCNQFFIADRIEENEKVRLASIHMYKRALVWHQQFVKTHGEDVDWLVYAEAVQKRFGSTIEDPLAELKNLRQNGSLKIYNDEFEQLLNKTEVTDKQSISFYLAGLQKDIELPVRMFKPHTLEDAMGLARMQEETIAVTKRS